MRTLSELSDIDDPAWPTIEAAMGDAPRPVAIVPADRAAREQTLVRLQVTTRSGLGALALETGGLLIDHGWLRVLAGGEPPLNLAIANGLDRMPPEPPGSMLVAFDVLGGRYELNGGSLPAAAGEVCYFAPDELRWVPLRMGHLDFVLWSMTERFDQFNEHLRWGGWEAEVARLGVDEGLSIYPFPFTVEGRDLSAVYRRAAPIVELLALWPDLARQLG